MADLNFQKNAQKRVFKGESSTGHVQFEFYQKLSQVYANRNDHVLKTDSIAYQ